VAALLTLYPKDSPSTSVLLREGESPVAGRDPESDIPLGDPRASTRHARFLWRGTEWWVLDLGSKNGTFVNGQRVRESELKGEDWISFGGLCAQYIQVTDVEMSAFLAGRAARRRSSGEVRMALEQSPDVPSLLTRLVESSVSMAAAERGTVLVSAAQGPLFQRAGAARCETPGETDSLELTLAVAERVLSTARPAVVADGKLEGGVGKGGALTSRSKAAVACIPLRDGDRVVGLLTMEGKLNGIAFSDLEVEFLESLADRASTLLNRFRVELRELRTAAVLSQLDAEQVN